MACPGYHRNNRGRARVRLGMALKYNIEGSDGGLGGTESAPKLKKVAEVIQKPSS